MTDDKLTTMAVHRSTLEALDKLRGYRRESYEDLLLKALQRLEELTPSPDPLVRAASSKEQARLGSIPEQ